MPGQHKSSALRPVPGLSPATPALECLLFARSPWLASSLLAFVFTDSPLGRLGAVALWPLSLGDPSLGSLSRHAPYPQTVLSHRRSGAVLWVGLYTL